jgi:primosomal protein N' (replication factor Y)
VDEAANKLGLALKIDLNNFVVGPAAPVVARVRNQYLMELLIKLPLDMKQIHQYKKAIKNQFNLLLSEKKFKGVVMIADVDAN